MLLERCASEKELQLVQALVLGSEAMRFQVRVLAPEVRAQYEQAMTHNIEKFLRRLLVERGVPGDVRISQYAANGLEDLPHVWVNVAQLTAGRLKSVRFLLSSFSPFYVCLRRLTCCF